jgi:excisionase family DNA binding protein
MTEELMTPEQVCEMLKISMSTLYKKRDIPRIKISRKMLRFSRSQVEKWLQSKYQRNKHQENKIKIMENVL